MMIKNTTIMTHFSKREYTHKSIVIKYYIFTGSWIYSANFFFSLFFMIFLYIKFISSTFSSIKTLNFFLILFFVKLKIMWIFSKIKIDISLFHNELHVHGSIRREKIIRFTRDTFPALRCFVWKIRMKFKDWNRKEITHNLFFAARVRENMSIWEIIFFLLVYFSFLYFHNNPEFEFKYN